MVCEKKSKFGLWKRARLVLIVTLFATLLGFPQRVEGMTDEQKTIRVGYPIQEGFTEIDEVGNYRGYTYEYLAEIAQYTGWDYEFVQIENTYDKSINELKDLLKEGKIDLIGGMYHGDVQAEFFDYSTYSYGSGTYILCASDSNTSLTKDNFLALSSIRIARLTQNEKRNEELQKYCDANNIQAEYVECGTREEQKQALKEGRADVMAEAESNAEKGYHVVANYSSKPFYFATTKGNRQLLNEIDSVILRIQSVSPFFEVELTEKYLNPPQESLVLSDEEKAYIALAQPLKVGFLTGLRPLQYVDEKSGELAGVSPAILDSVKAETGLAMEYFAYTSAAAMKADLQAGKIQMAAGIIYNYDIANSWNVVLSRPYITGYPIRLMNKKLNGESLDGKKQALVRGVEQGSSSDENIVYYQTMEQCLEAVEKGDADFTYVYSYAGQYILLGKSYENLMMLPREGLSSRVCFALAKPVDPRLLKILNKTVYGIPEQKVQSLIYENVFQEEERVTLIRFIKENSVAVIVTALIVFAAVLGILVWQVKIWKKLHKRLGHQLSRYEQLYDLTHEFFFEYDYVKDRFKMPQRMADYFDCEPVIENYRSQMIGEDPEMQESQREFWKELEAHKEASQDLCLRMKDGHPKWLHISVKNICDDKGRPLYGIGKVVDIDDEKHVKEELVFRAQRDPLSELYNTAASRKLIEEILKKGGDNARGYLFVIDIDFFKHVNDKYGHPAGDQVIVHLGKVLTESFRKTDIVGRVGGDEFVVYMRGQVDALECRRRCEKLKSRTSELLFNGVRLNVTLSIGVTATDENVDLMEFYRRADKALYKVKNEGRNGYYIAGCD